MHEKYHPKLDISHELNDNLTTCYQQMIGILRWAVESGRIDIITEVSVLFSFNTSSSNEQKVNTMIKALEYLNHVLEIYHKRRTQLKQDLEQPQ